MSFRDDDTIEDRTSFDFVRYANCWEDADLLCEALEVGPGDRVLSVGSAGDNALALLAEGAEVVAADVSPAQIACIELRKAAFRRLDYDDVLAFLGVRPSLSRLRTYRTALCGDLSESSRRYWNERPGMIRDGIVHRGKFERYFELFREHALPLVHTRGTVYELLREKSLERRRQFYREQWDTWRWRLMFRVFFSQFVLGRLGRDPEFFRYVDGPVSEEILDRTEYALTEVPTHTNPYVEYILTGTFSQNVPPYLERDRFEAARQRLEDLTVVHAPVEAVAAESPPGHFDGFNLSDIFEYVSEKKSAAIIDALLGAASSGARLAYWNMLVPRRGRELRPERLEARSDISEPLFAEDRAFFYGDFVVEEVV